jgi:hypothetical protein
MAAEDDAEQGVQEHVRGPGKGIPMLALELGNSEV